MAYGTDVRTSFEAAAGAVYLLARLTETEGWVFGLRPWKSGRCRENTRAQLNRAVNSIGLNIAEGTAKSSHKAFDHYLEISLGSVFEVVAAAFLAMDRTYITKVQHDGLYDYGQRLAKSINAFRSTLLLS
jgi:four helix bundle protein